MYAATEVQGYVLKRAEILGYLYAPIMHGLTNLMEACVLHAKWRITSTQQNIH